jgi:peptidylprolyl isomerase
MKFSLRLLVLGAAALQLLGGCGGAQAEHGEAPTAPPRPQGPTRIKDSARKPPKITLPSAPPRKLIVKDIRVGTGAAIPAHGRAHIATNYISVSFRTGKTREVWWKPKGGFSIEFGPGLEVKGWEKGLVGMRVGGRRELLVPSSLAYGEGALLYVIDLLAVE